MNIKQLAFFGTATALTMGAVDTVQAAEGTYFAALGAGASFSPDYEGSDDYEVGGMPFLSLGWKADIDVPSDGTGLQLGLHDITLNLPQSLDVGLAKLYRPEGTYRFSAGLSYNAGRDANDNAALKGMGDIDAYFSGSVGINFQAKDSGWQYGLRYTGSDDNGSELAGQIGYAHPLSDTLVITPTIHTTWADDEQMQTYFGVSQQQARTSINNEFDTESGLKSVGLGVNLDWTITENWMLNSGLDYTRLTYDAADSPLVKTEGSPDQFGAFTALIYSF